MYYPTVGTIILLTFTYMSMFPWVFRLMVLGVVYFFTHKAVQKDDAEMATAKQVMAALQELVDAEDKRNPLSDEKLASLLKQKGYDIARRTIAKYREIMKIPIARMRK